MTMLNHVKETLYPSIIERKDTYRHSGRIMNWNASEDETGIKLASLCGINVIIFIQIIFHITSNVD